MYEIIIVIDVLAAVGLIGLVLLQQGKGADMGAAFGSGASQTLFGSRGTANFLTRSTAVLATVFFAANLLLAYMATTQRSTSVTELPAVSTEPQVPAAPAPPPAMPAPPAVPEVPK